MPESQPTIFAGVKVLNGERAGHVLYPMPVDTVVGRLQSAQLFLPDMRASRKHCLIAFRNGRYFLIDMSSNGTSLNGQRVERTTEMPLQSGDVIKIGATEIEFRLAQAPAPAAPQAAPEPPGMEFVFDFEGESTDGGGLDKVFYDFEEKDKWSSLSTQRMPSLGEEIERHRRQQQQPPPPPPRQ